MINNCTFCKEAYCMECSEASNWESYCSKECENRMIVDNMNCSI